MDSLSFCRLLDHNKIQLHIFFSFSRLIFQSPKNWIHKKVQFLEKYYRKNVLQIFNIKILLHYFHLPFPVSFEKREKLTYLPNHWPHKHFIPAFQASAPCTNSSANFRTVVDLGLLLHLPNNQYPYKHFLQAFQAPAPCTNSSANIRTAVDLGLLLNPTSTISVLTFYSFVLWTCAMQLPLPPTTVAPR